MLLILFVLVALACLATIAGLWLKICRWDRRNEPLYQLVEVIRERRD